MMAKREAQMRKAVILRHRCFRDPKPNYEALVGWLKKLAAG